MALFGNRRGFREWGRGLAERGGVQLTAAPEFDPTRWYERGGVEIDPVTGRGTYGPTGEVFDPTLPTWAAGYRGFEDPGLFYDWYRSFPEGPSPAIRADLAETSANVQAQEEARQAALGTLGETRQRVSGAAEAFAEDPDRAFIAERLRERMEEDAITEKEQAAAHQAMSGAGAIAANLARTQAGARGQAGGGLASQRQVMLDALTRARGVEIDARIARANREAAERATGQLASYSLAAEAREQAYQQALGEIDTRIALLQSQPTLADTDFLALQELDFSKQLLEAERLYSEEVLQAFEESQEYDWQDLISDTLNFLSAGGLEILFD